MRLTLRWRVVLVGVVAAIVGYNVPGLMRLMRRHLPVTCGSSFPGSGLVCGANPTLSAGDLLRALAFLVGLALLFGLAIWAARPVHEFSRIVSRVGPQNLGYRIQSRGTRDELDRLGHSLDAMMDRIAAGYEGQRQFAANASHELRTPLAVQRTLIEVSLAGPLSSDQIELVTRQLLQTNERNEQLIEGLLVLSESDRGLITRSPQRLDLVVAHVLDAHSDLARAAGVTLVRELAERSVLGEEVLLDRLVSNLVRNAIKYNHAGGYVRVVVGDGPSLVVTNSGDPVPAESVDVLFEPFRRFRGERISQDGAGLGLTIARSIVNAHHGVIAASPGPDGGLRIQVQLPPS